MEMDINFCVSSLLTKIIFHCRIKYFLNLHNLKIFDISLISSDVIVMLNADVYFTHIVALSPTSRSLEEGEKSVGQTVSHL
jgi:hypothetical protein